MIPSTFNAASISNKKWLFSAPSSLTGSRTAVATPGTRATIEVALVEIKPLAPNRNACKKTYSNTKINTGYPCTGTIGPSFKSQGATRYVNITGNANMTIVVK
ncbi:MAG: hypothetical protein ACRCUP_02820 [Mycoplasmatales bacterium]